VTVGETYPLEEASAAQVSVATGHGRGKVVLLVDSKTFGTIESCFAGLLPEPEDIPERRAPRRVRQRSVRPLRRQASNSGSRFPR
jgi:hypothetical protein